LLPVSSRVITAEYAASCACLPNTRLSFHARFHCQAMSERLLDPPNLGSASNSPQGKDKRWSTTTQAHSNHSRACLVYLSRASSKGLFFGSRCETTARLHRARFVALRKDSPTCPYFSTRRHLLCGISSTGQYVRMTHA
jgi:hypothetical protein